MSDAPDQPHRSGGLIRGVVGRVAPAVMRQIDTHDLVDAIDVNVIAQDLDLDVLLDRLDVNAIAERLDLDALLERLDVNAIASRLDMAQLTAGATEDIAVSGLDLVRRQLVRADATVDGLVDRVLRRQPGRRPEAPRDLATADPPAAPAILPPEGFQRRAVSGHYAGPVTRILAVAGDVFAAVALQAAVASVLLFVYGIVLGSDEPGDVARWTGIVLLFLLFVGWFWIPVAFFGRTLAMAVLGIAVVRRDGGVVDGRRALVRALILPVSLLIPISFLGLVLGRERRTLHDALSGTAVVYDWGAREAEQPVTIRDQLSARVRRRQLAVNEGDTAAADESDESDVTRDQ